MPGMTADAADGLESMTADAADVLESMTADAADMLIIISKPVPGCLA